MEHVKQEMTQFFQTVLLMWGEKTVFGQSHCSGVAFFKRKDGTEYTNIGLITVENKSNKSNGNCGVFEKIMYLRGKIYTVVIMKTESKLDCILSNSFKRE